jgi:hypothetical protein
MDRLVAVKQRQRQSWLLGGRSGVGLSGRRVKASSSSVICLFAKPSARIKRIAHLEGGFLPAIDQKHSTALLYERQHLCDTFQRRAISPWEEFSWRGDRKIYQTSNFNTTRTSAKMSWLENCVKSSMCRRKPAEPSKRPNIMS